MKSFLSFFYPQGVGIFRWPQHRDFGWPSGISIFFHISLILFKDWAWNLPLYVHYSYSYLQYAIYGFTICFFISLTCSLGIIKKHKHIYLLLFGSILILTLFFKIYLLNEKPIYLTLKNITEDNVILQSSPYSCVPAATANIMISLGIIASEKQLAKDFNTTRNGTNIAQLIYGLEKYSLAGKRKNIKYKNISKVHTPAILFIDHELAGPESHAVALIKQSNQSVIICDPLIGQMTLSVEEFKKTWRGKAVEIESLS